MRHKSSAVANHILNNPSHSIDFNNAKIVEKEPYYFARKFKEALYIALDPNHMNRDEGKKISPILTSSLLPVLKLRNL